MKIQNFITILFGKLLMTKLDHGLWKRQSTKIARFFRPPTTKLVFLVCQLTQVKICMVLVVPKPHSDMDVPHLCWAFCKKQKTRCGWGLESENRRIVGPRASWGHSLRMVDETQYGLLYKHCLVVEYWRLYEKQAYACASANGFSWESQTFTETLNAITPFSLHQDSYVGRRVSLSRRPKGESLSVHPEGSSSGRNAVAKARRKRLSCRVGWKDLKGRERMKWMKKKKKRTKEQQEKRKAE